MIEFDSLKLSGFRNFDDEILEFVPGTNIILGQNGHGKSNLLEALYLVCTGKSFRTSFIKELIGFNKTGFLVEASVKKQNIHHKIKIELYPHKKKLQINNTSYSHLHPLMGFLPVVIITPEMKKIIDGGPLERRKFIDFLASQLSKPYFESITRYHKALKQRNAALKFKQPSSMWEQLMAKEWIFIDSFRNKLIARLEKLSNDHLLKYPHLEAEIKLQYTRSTKDNTSLASEDAICKFYQMQKAQDLHAGTTLYGPHREDVTIILNGSKAELTASEGQKKMLVVALCLASYNLLQESLGLEPLLLIDDYDAHFDGIRKNWITSELKEMKQAFLTSPLDELTGQQGTFYIEKGKFIQTMEGHII